MIRGFIYLITFKEVELNWSIALNPDQINNTDRREGEEKKDN